MYMYISLKKLKLPTPFSRSALAIAIFVYPTVERSKFSLVASQLKQFSRRIQSTCPHTEENNDAFQKITDIDTLW